MKFNPYKPNSIVHPGMFSGRVDEIKSLEKALFQTQHGNPMHFLIHGERGIGKSSLLLTIDHVARGRFKPLEGDNFSFLTVNIELEQYDNFGDIVGKIARELQRELDADEMLKKSLKDLWNFITSWQVLGIKYTPTTMPKEAMLDELCHKVATLAKHKAFDGSGIFFFIDEADKPDASSGLGQFVKMFTERLTKKSINNVGLGVIGISNVIEKMRESHESSTRVLHTFLLKPLKDAERKEVVNLGLAEANRKNATATKIDGAALQLLATLSEGYPHFIQQYAYSAFDQDTDNIISIDDVKTALVKDNGALDQLGQRYFENMYSKDIRSDDYRRVLQLAAQKMPDAISRKELLVSSGLSASQVTNAVTALKKRGSLIPVEGKDGIYKLPSVSFAAWIQAFKVVQEEEVE